MDGFFVGTLVGALEGAFVGALVGLFVGSLVGDFVGTLVGFFVGALVGPAVTTHCLHSGPTGFAVRIGGVFTGQDVDPNSSLLNSGTWKWPIFGYR